MNKLKRMKQKYRETKMPLRRKYQIEKMAATMYKNASIQLTDSEQDAWKQVVQNEDRLI